MQMSPSRGHHSSFFVSNMATFTHLLPPSFAKETMQWLEDDCPSFDVGGFVVGEKIETAFLYCKSGCVLAGVPFVNAILHHLGLSVRWLVEEGSKIDVDVNANVVVAHVTGRCRNILLAERTCLNILSRASGVAAAARYAASIKAGKNWHGYIAGTRKTTPGFRTVEKYALIVGGVATHRLDLSQMVMLKDNHICSSGNITNAVAIARQAAGFSMKIEVIILTPINITKFFSLIHRNRWNAKVLRKPWKLQKLELIS